MFIQSHCVLEYGSSQSLTVLGAKVDKKPNTMKTKHFKSRLFYDCVLSQNVTIVASCFYFTDGYS